MNLITKLLERVKKKGRDTETAYSRLVERLATDGGVKSSDENLDEVEALLAETDRSIADLEEHVELHRERARQEVVAQTGDAAQTRAKAAAVACGEHEGKRKRILAELDAEKVSLDNERSRTSEAVKAARRAVTAVAVLDRRIAEARTGAPVGPTAADRVARNQAELELRSTEDRLAQECEDLKNAKRKDAVEETRDRIRILEERRDRLNAELGNAASPEKSATPVTGGTSR